jgi:cytochrome c oxidase cbb3-type subunit 3
MTEENNQHSHDFDGIVELDNDLPRWWLGIFWVSIALAVFYIPYFHFIHPEKLPAAALEAQMAQREAELAAQEAQEPPVADAEAELQKAYAAGGWEATAKEKFALCVPCHAADGGGTVGPNFTDDYYIHGGRLSDIRRTITEGVPSKGMISWKGMLKPEEIEALAFYIRSLRGTTPAVPKAPEGQLVDEAGNFLEDAPAPAEE